MRSVSVVCVLLLLPAIAAAQATIIGGTASNWAPAYGVYAAPYVPLVTTPSVSLSTVSPSPVGASNATWGLVAGATNSTLSSGFVATPSAGTYTEPVWYGGSPNEMGEAPMHGHMHGPRKGEEHGFDFVASSWSERGGVARAMGRTSTARKASRTYTNQDIDQMNQKTGTVKYNGKTEKL